ncbi:MAG TPA: YkvA family protein [Candidatus Limnocylindrales bacterium]|nr:YkvA family protein [Candidatus Limnocylindrales bacterium]
MSGRLRYLRLARLVWKLPTYARIVWGLLRDPRTPLPLKALLGAGLAYVVVPIDLVPDAIPILGQADDLTVLLLVLDLFIANAPRQVREEQVARARNGTAQLDDDLARLRELLGDRYDQIRDRLPELLERYGDLRDSRAVKAVLRDWRLRRLRTSATRAAASGDTESSDREPAAAGLRDTPLN